MVAATQRSSRKQAMASDEDTIFALSSAPGRAAVAIIRISGARARAVGTVFGCALPSPREIGLRKLRDGTRMIDQALVLVFDKPHSYTGEDVVELQIHGGRSVYDSVILCLVERAGFRFAEPGEFSRRAVLNGRLDLTAAEAVNDLVNAETEAQRQLALTQLDGGLAGKFEAWAHNILQVRAHIEAYIDFPDEEMPLTVIEKLTESLAISLGSMGSFLDDKHKGERLRDGLRIAVIGPPNAGKSTLINWLADREVAIVSKHAGTTRDVIEVHLDLGGYPVVVADTAGLRAGGDEVEIEGMRRARDWADRADLRVLLLDATVRGLGDPIGHGLVDGDLVLVNKVDLVDRVPDWPGSLPVSMARGDGLVQALERLTTLAREMMDVGGQPMMTRTRHRAALLRCRESVERALGGLNAEVSPEIVAEDLRVAADDLGRVTGRVDVEALLDVVFRDFCIGK